MSAANGRERDLPAVAARVGREDYGFGSMSLAELRSAWDDEMADKPGECVCPVLEDGTRGFRMRCPVHGGRDREDFARLTALRGEIGSRLRAPASARQWGRNPS